MNRVQTDRIRGRMMQTVQTAAIQVQTAAIQTVRGKTAGNLISKALEVDRQRHCQDLDHSFDKKDL